MRPRWMTVMVVAFCAVMFFASVATAQFLLCLTEPKLKGEKTVGVCSAQGAKFAFVSKSGICYIPTKEEMDLTMAFNPKLGQLPAYGMEFGGQSPKIPPMPPIGDQ